VRTSGLSLLLALCLATHVRAQPTRPKPVALAISGGVSLGSWEAGLNWGLVRHMRVGGNHHLAAVSGASAGNINAILTAMAWCEADGPDGKPRGRATDNPFYRTWVHVGLEALLPTDDEAPPHEVQCVAYDHRDRNVAVRIALEGLDHPDDYLRTISSVLRPDELMCRGVELGALLRSPRYRSCSVPISFTVTRARPGTLQVAPGVTVATQRFSVLLEAASTRGGPLRLLPYAPPDHPRSDWESSPAVGLSLRPVTLPDGRVPELAFIDYMRASSAFPIAFPPVLLEHCAESCAYEQPADQTSRFGGHCASGQRLCREPFLDGGVFDNVPLGLAVTQTERLRPMQWRMRGDGGGSVGRTRGAEPPRYIYLDPTQIRGRPDPGPTQPSVFGCLMDRDSDCVGLGHLTAFGLNFIDTARQYELQWVGRTLSFRDPDTQGPGRALVLSSRHPRISGRYWGNYGGFIDEPLRRFDYCAGIYDAMVLIGREQCAGASDQALCAAEKLPTIAADLGLYDPSEAVALDIVQRLASHEQTRPITWRDGRTIEPSECARRPGAECCPPCQDTDPVCEQKRQMCIVHQALEGPGDIAALRTRLVSLGYTAEGSEAKAMLADLDGWQADLGRRITRRLAAVERHDRNVGGERLFEGLEFYSLTNYDVRGPWAFDADPSTIPADDDDLGATLAHLLLPHALSGSVRSSGLLIDLWEPTLRLWDSHASTSLVLSPWLRQGAGHNYGSFSLVTGLDRVAWPLLGQLRLGPGGFVRYDEGTPPPANACAFDDRLCLGFRVQLGLLWDKIRVTGGLTRFGPACEARHLFDEPDAGCADVFLTLGVSDVRGMLYWLARIF